MKVPTITEPSAFIALLELPWEPAGSLIVVAGLPVAHRAVKLVAIVLFCTPPVMKVPVVLEATKPPTLLPAGRPKTTPAAVPGQRTGLVSQLPSVKFPSGLTPFAMQLLKITGVPRGMNPPRVQRKVATLPPLMILPATTVPSELTPIA